MSMMRELFPDRPFRVVEVRMPPPALEARPDGSPSETVLR
jgi:hypothetical protein